jgi:hypothetical protein
MAAVHQPSLVSRRHPAFAPTIPAFEDALMHCDEGRASEPARRSTRDLLFTAAGWPSPWLLLLTAVCLLVGIGTLR